MEHRWPTFAVITAAVMFLLSSCGASVRCGPEGEPAPHVVQVGKLLLGGPSACPLDPPANGTLCPTEDPVQFSNACWYTSEGRRGQEHGCDAVQCHCEGQPLRWNCGEVVF